MSAGTKVLVLAGPGFADQGDLLQQLRFNHDIRLSVFNVGSGVTQLLIEEIKTSDFVLLRGPWTATPEEMIYASLLAERLKPSFDLLRERIEQGQNPRIVGLGRGALMMMHSALPGAQTLLGFEWMSELKESGPWASVRFAGIKADVFAQVQGRAIPKILAQAQGSLSPWVTMSTGQVAGWRLSKGIYVSFVDLLALADRSQLADYGYLDLTAVSTQADVLGWMLAGRLFSD